MCSHRWKLYDVYWAAGWPNNFGNEKCEQCGERRKGIILTDAEVKAYIARSEMTE